MTKPSFSMTFNLGHVLQIISLIVAMTVGYVTMDARTTANSKGIADLTEEMDATRVRVRAVETSTIRADERMERIFGLLSRIDNRLERIEKQ